MFRQLVFALLMASMAVVPVYVTSFARDDGGDELLNLVGAVGLFFAIFLTILGSLYATSRRKKR